MVNFTGIRVKDNHKITSVEQLAHRRPKRCLLKPKTNWFVTQVAINRLSRLTSGRPVNYKRFPMRSDNRRGF